MISAIQESAFKFPNGCENWQGIAKTDNEIELPVQPDFSDVAQNEFRTRSMLLCLSGGNPEHVAGKVDAGDIETLEREADRDIPGSASEFKYAVGLERANQFEQALRQERFSFYEAVVCFGENAFDFSHILLLNAYYRLMIN
jgi:hypothetical protein